MLAACQPLSSCMLPQHAPCYLPPAAPHPHPTPFLPFPPFIDLTPVVHTSLPPFPLISPGAPQLDLLIVLVSVLVLATASSTLRVFKALRVQRALKPLRWAEMRWVGCVRTAVRADVPGLPLHCFSSLHEGRPMLLTPAPTHVLMH